jgi:predicted transcriptional regulator
MRGHDLKALYRSWGLKPPDAKVFHACLERGTGAYVHEIVTRTKLKRSTVDLILARLVERGFVTRLRVGQRHQYFAEKPEMLLQKQKQDLDLFQALLPMLQSLQQQKDMPAIRLYQGAEGIAAHYKDILSILSPLPAAERILYSVESGTDVIHVYPGLDRFIRERVRRGISIHIICPQSAEAGPYHTSKQHLRQCRYFKDTKKLFSMALYLYADRVALISLRPPLQVVVIQHSVVSGSMRTLHDLLWLSLSDQTQTR